jgi:hypothetical protein
MRLILILAAALTMTLPALRAQYKFFTPKGSYTVEVSLDNSPYLRLPIYRNAITSLAVVGDYAIGGTSANAGLSPYVFAVALSRRKLEMVLPLEKVIAGQRSIRSGFGRGPNGLLYAGTMPDKEGGDGHLIAVQVKNGKIDVADLGVPVPGEGIFALTADTKRGSLYGISHPSGNFFVFHAKDRSTEVYTET